MIKIGITGSLASGKTTASKILSLRRGPLFSADLAVKELYRNKNFKSIIVKKFGLKSSKQLKKSLKSLIHKNESQLRKLEKIIHPLVRKKIRKFTSNNKNKKILFYDIPLLIESKLMKFFDVIIFVKAKKKFRLKRFKSKGGDDKLFNILNNKQMSVKRKINYCDHVVVNEKNINTLKKKLSVIISRYA